MPLVPDFFDWADNAGITIDDQDIIKHARFHYRTTPDGRVVVVLLEFKADSVPFPDGLTEFDGKITFDD